jgi:hypothetical protein
MEYKKCSKCNVEKSTSDFHKSGDKFKSACKECRNMDNREWRIKNRESMLKSSKKWRDNNKDYMSKYYEDNKELFIEYRSKYYEVNKNEIIEKVRFYKFENRDIIKESSKLYYELNKSKIIEKAKIYIKKRYKDKPHIFIHRNILNRYLRWINESKLDRTNKLLGYTSNELKIHLESLFKDGMSWENYGKWHVDHIRPIVSFDKNELPSIVNSLSNLQPLWAYENLLKGSKYE